MTASVLQENQNSTNSSVTSLAVTLAGVTAGSSIGVLITADDTAGTTSATVSDGTAYTSGNAQHNPTFQQFSQSFYLQNVSAGSHTITVTLDNFHPAVGIWAVEVGGVATASFDGKNVSEQTTPTTGTDAVTVTSTPASTKQPALVLAWSFSVANNPAPAAGTGFTAGPTAWNFTAGNQCRSESKRVTATGTQTATFTAGVNTSHDTFILVFDELGASAGTSPGGFDQIQQPRAGARSGAGPAVAPPLPGVSTAALSAWGYEPATARQRGPEQRQPASWIPLDLPRPTAPFSGFEQSGGQRAPQSTRRDPAVASPVPAVASSVVAWGGTEIIQRAKPASVINGNQALPALPAPHQLFPLSVSANRRHLVDASGSPFPIVGESAWLLFNEITATQAGVYLDDRQARGFNTVLVQLLSKVQSNSPNNNANDSPFTGTLGGGDPDFGTPREAYFAHVDDVIKMALARGMWVMIAIVYGGFAGTGGVRTDGWWNELVSNGTTRAQAFGNYVETRLGGNPNIGYVMGGDLTPPGGNGLYDSIATGIKVVNATRIITSHWDQTTNSPNGILSTNFTPPTPDLNSVYSWVGTTSTSKTIYTFERTAYAVAGPIPSAIIEAVYQNNTGQGGTAQTTWMQAWMGLAEGGCGPGICGNEAIWQFSSANTHVPTQAQGWGDWHGHLADGGPAGVGAIATYLQARSWQKLVPDTGTSIVTSGRGTFGSTSYVGVSRASDRSFGFCYIPAGGSITVDMTQFNGPITASWVDPSNGTSSTISGSPFAASGTHVFDTSTAGSGGNNAAGNTDWVLALDGVTLAAVPLQFVQEPQRPALPRIPWRQAQDAMPGVAAAALVASGYDTVGAARKQPAPERRPAADVLPPNVLSVGWDFAGPAILGRPAQVRRSDAIEVLSSPSVGLSGYDQAPVVMQVMRMRAWPASDPMPAIVVAPLAWGYDVAPLARRGSPSILPANASPIPGLAATWGYDSFTAPAPASRAQRPFDSAPPPAPVVVTLAIGWGYEPAFPVGRKSVIDRRGAEQPLPGPLAVVQLTAWGYEAQPSRLRGAGASRHVATEPIVSLAPVWGFDVPVAWRPPPSGRAFDAPPMPAVIVVASSAAWGYEIYPARTQIPIARRVAADPLPASAPSPPSWGFEASPLRPAAPGARALAASGVLPALVLPQWGWDAPATVAVARRSTAAASALPPPVSALTISSWGYQLDASPPRAAAHATAAGDTTSPDLIVLIPGPWGFEPIFPQPFAPILPHWIESYLVPLGDPLLLFSAVAPRERTIVVLPHSRVFRVRAK